MVQKFCNKIDCEPNLLALMYSGLGSSLSTSLRVCLRYNTMLRITEIMVFHRNFIAISMFVTRIRRNLQGIYKVIKNFKYKVA